MSADDLDADHSTDEAATEIVLLAVDAEETELAPAGGALWRRPTVAVVASVVLAVALVGTGVALVTTGDGGAPDRLSAAAPSARPTTSPTASAEPSAPPSPLPSVSPSPSPSASVAPSAASANPPSPTRTTTAPAPAPAPVPPPAPASAPAVAPTTEPPPSSPPAAGDGEITVEIVNNVGLDLEWHFNTGSNASQRVATVPAGGRTTVVYRPHPETAVGVGAFWTQNPECGNGDAFTMQSPGNYTLTAYVPDWSGGPSEACGGHREFTVQGPG